jgi:hypothetical protein
MIRLALVFALACGNGPEARSAVAHGISLRQWVLELLTHQTQAKPHTVIFPGLGSVAHEDAAAPSRSCVWG